MAISVRRAFALASEGELSVDEVLKTLYESEGVQGCRLNPRPGHPLQHVAVLMYPVASPRRSRPAWPDPCMRPAGAVRSHAPGTSIRPRGPGNAKNKSHSMFETDEHAAILLAIR